MLSIKKTGGSTEYGLPLLTGEAIVRLTDWYDKGEFAELYNTLDTWTSPEMPRRKVGSLYWPIVGASRFAHAVLPIDTYTLGLLRADLGTTNAVTLSYTDEADDAARTFDMYLIASRPVSQTNTGGIPTDEPAEDDLWLITLVDKRWYWVQETGTGQSSSYTPGTWTTLFTDLFSRCVGGSFTQDTIDSDYSTPGARWLGSTMENVPVAYMLDDAAQCIGQRVVVTPSGVKVQNPSSTNKTALTDWHDDNVADDRLGAGGLIDTTERLQGIPKVYYTNWPDHTVETVNASTGLASTNFYAWLDVPDAMGSSARTAALAQWKNDFYAWQDTPVDATYDGFVAPPLSGFLMAVELYHDASDGYTRAQAPPPCYQVVTNRLMVRPPASSSSQSGFFARLTTESGGNWNFYKLKLSAGAYTDDGAEVTGYNAVPSVLYPTFTANPETGLRVWMIPSQQAGKYEFLPIGYCDDTHPGLISTTTQFVGDGTKKFLGEAISATAVTATGIGSFGDGTGQTALVSAETGLSPSVPFTIQSVPATVVEYNTPNPDFAFVTIGGMPAGAFGATLSLSDPYEVFRGTDLWVIPAGIPNRSGRMILAGRYATLSAGVVGYADGVYTGITGQFTAASGELITVMNGIVVAASPPLSPPPLTTYLQDSFTDANGTDLLAHNLDIDGTPWDAVDNGAAEVQSNRASMTVDTPDPTNITAVYKDAGVTDVVVSADIIVGGSSGIIAGVMARVQDGNNYWSLEYRESTVIDGGTNAIKLVKCVAGTRTFEATYSLGTPGTPLTGTHSVKLRALGDVLTGYWDDVAYVSVTDSTYNTETRHGIALIRAVGLGLPMTPIDNFLLTSTS